MPHKHHPRNAQQRHGTRRMPLVLGFRNPKHARPNRRWRVAVCNAPHDRCECCAYCVDDGPIKLWVPGDPIPPEFIEAAQNPNWLVHAFNDGFERRIEQHIMGPRYGWPIIPVERHRCSQAAALALALPAELKGVAHALKLSEQKDDSQALMLQMAKPRRPRKDEDPSKTYWYDDAERAGASVQALQAGRCSRTRPAPPHWFVERGGTAATGRWMPRSMTAESTPTVSCSTAPSALPRRRRSRSTQNSSGLPKARSRP